MEQNRSLAAHGIHRIFNRFSITQSKSGSLTVTVTPCSGNPDRSALYRKSAFPYNLTIGGQPRANLPAGDPWRNRSSRNAGQSSPSDARPCRFRTIERDRYLSASKTRSTRPTMKSAFPTGVPSPWTIPPTPGSAALSTNCEGRRTPAR